MWYNRFILLTLSTIKQSGTQVPTGAIERTRTLSQEAASHIVQIFQFNEAAHTTNHLYVFNIQPVFMALTGFTENPNILPYRSEIVDLCVSSRAVGRRSPFAMAVLRKFQLIIRECRKPQPPGTEHLFEKFE